MSLQLSRTSSSLLSRAHRGYTIRYPHSTLFCGLISHSWPISPQRWSSGSSDPASTQNSKQTSPVVTAPLPTRVWKKVKHEAAHYWHGSKLLVSEVRISTRLQWKILHGENLTRRERRQVWYLCWPKWQLAEAFNETGIRSSSVLPQTSCDLFRLQSLWLFHSWSSCFLWHSNYFPICCHPHLKIHMQL
jgi:hypothetical protein